MLTEYGKVFKKQNQGRWVENLNYTIAVGSITYAIKGRDVLRKAGVKSHVERKTNQNGNSGCGYVIIAEGNRKKIIDLLNGSGIKVISIGNG